MTVRELMKVLKADGWYQAEQEGSHIQMKHDTKKGKVTVPNHNGDIKIKTLNSILRQAGKERHKEP
jgi:predicted RNA binding protein YcfA (HicA-like mRNA interferase family)